MNLILISRNKEKLEKTKQEILLINSTVKIKLIAVDFSEGKEAFDKIRAQLDDIPIGILGNKNHYSLLFTFFIIYIYNPPYRLLCNMQIVYINKYKVQQNIF